MNVKIGIEASQFPEKECINGIFLAAREMKLITTVRQRLLSLIFVQYFSVHTMGIKATVCRYDSKCNHTFFSCQGLHSIEYKLPLTIKYWRMNSCEQASRARIFKLFRSPRVDSKESIPPTYVAWRAGTITLFLLSS
jgi:hypothetical protein